MKYSILLPYHRRRQQFTSTLASYAHHYQRTDFEVIVVADVKTPADELAWLRQQPVTVLEATQQDARWTNPACHFNQAAQRASGAYLLVSNPEVFHATDVLAGLDAVFAEKPNAYVLCGCESIRETALAVGQKPTHHMWYQHASNPRDLHFCAALAAENYFRIGGFDEGYLQGLGYDDDDFREAVRAGGLEFVRRDDLLTYHLHHDRAHQKLHDYHQRLHRNKSRYEAKWFR